MAITTTCPECSETFRVKDQTAGRQARCPVCQSWVTVRLLQSQDFQPELNAGLPWIHEAFERDRFFFRQKLLTIGEKYTVWDEEQQPILFIERPAHFLQSVLSVVVAWTGFFFFLTVAGAATALLKHVEPRWLGGLAFLLLLMMGAVFGMFLFIALSPKRHISFFADETRGELLMQVLQDSKFQPIVSTYTVTIPEVGVVGHIKKNILTNIIRKRWEVLDPHGNLVLLAKEDSLLFSLLRRFLGPLFGFLRTNFLLMVPWSEGPDSIRGEFIRRFAVLDRYILDLTRDTPRMIDRRLAAALGVMLDTGERR